MNIEFHHDDDFAFAGLTHRSPDSPAPNDVLTPQLSPTNKRVCHSRDIPTVIAHSHTELRRNDYRRVPTFASARLLTAT